MPRWTSLGLAILTLLVPLAPALAAGKEPDLPPPDPPGHWHHMTADPATTASRCVGSTKTPLCAIETVMACRARSDEALCRVGFIPGFDWSDLSLSKHLVSEFTYRFVWALQVITTQYELEDGRLMGVDLRAGDLLIAIKEEDCSPNRSEPDCELDEIEPPVLYVVREIQGAWRVVGWDQAAS